MLGKRLTQWGGKAFDNFVAITAEREFKSRIVAFCYYFTPAHIQKAAESGRPLNEIIGAGGFNVKPTPESNLNPWARYLVALPDEDLLQLVKDAVSPDHVAMLEQYPIVAVGIIQYVKGMVIHGQ